MVQFSIALLSIIIAIIIIHIVYLVILDFQSPSHYDNDDDDATMTKAKNGSAHSFVLQWFAYPDN